MIVTAITRHRTCVVLVTVLLSVFATAVRAQSWDFSNIEFQKAVVAFLMIDESQRQCGSGMNATDQKKMAAWETQNAVPALRTRVREISDEKLARKVLNKLDGEIKTNIAALTKQVGACQFALSYAQHKDAQFAQRYPSLVAALNKSARNTTPPSVAASDPRDVPRQALQPINPPGNVLALWGYMAHRMRANGLLILTEELAVALKDGTITTDIGAVFNGDVASSKRKNSSDWGTWRKHGGNVEVKWNSDDSYQELIKHWVVRAGKADQRLAGCFGRLTSASDIEYGGNSMVGRADGWCFTKDGRFTHDVVAFGSSPNVVMSASQPGVQGRYRIDGNVAEFVYDNGSKVRKAFGFLNKDLTHIALDDKRLMGR